MLNVMPTHFCRAPTFVSLSLRITWHKYQFGGETSCGHSLDFCLIESKESYDLSVCWENLQEEHR